MKSTSRVSYTVFPSPAFGNRGEHNSAIPDQAVEGVRTTREKGNGGEGRRRGRGEKEEEEGEGRRQRVSSDN